ncbi:unnamed protein product (macronuclear) [Paramecium tetraurelia]|uniref:Transmembrane protein n=1 Tax=Paramecium tetraurelia TaxID=5888 RepID=A0EC17_PARTE|nr:uncharacterized protein GSPATT00025570001 [Paramecium tetraurelia]CAK92834.1 unnamed protein product [Paramecium tetraurelia]|eukprot:XP_001460231.1 hypothetical protein (macronuclear) [Paramecium tetraurelia strain d4-2]
MNPDIICNLYSQAQYYQQYYYFPQQQFLQYMMLQNQTPTLPILQYKYDTPTLLNSGITQQSIESVNTTKTVQNNHTTEVNSGQQEKCPSIEDDSQSRVNGTYNSYAQDIGQNKNIYNIQNSLRVTSLSLSPNMIRINSSQQEQPLNADLIIRNSILFQKVKRKVDLRIKSQPLSNPEIVFFDSIYVILQICIWNKFLKLLYPVLIFKYKCKYINQKQFVIYFQFDFRFIMTYYLCILRQLKPNIFVCMFLVPCELANFIIKLLNPSQ